MIGPSSTTVGSRNDLDASYCNYRVFTVKEFSDGFSPDDANRTFSFAFDGSHYYPISLNADNIELFLEFLKALSILEDRLEEFFVIDLGIAFYISSFLILHSCTILKNIKIMDTSYNNIIKRIL